MHVHCVYMVIFNPVGGTQIFKYGGSVTRFFLSGSLQIFDLLVHLQFPQMCPSGHFASSVCS